MALECNTITLRQFVDILKMFDKEGNGNVIGKKNIFHLCHDNTTTFVLFTNRFRVGN